MKATQMLFKFKGQSVTLLDCKCQLQLNRLKYHPAMIVIGKNNSINIALLLLLRVITITKKFIFKLLFLFLLQGLSHIEFS